MSVVRPVPLGQVTAGRTVTVTATQVEERTFRAVIETPLGGPYNVFVHRELVFRDAGGEIVEVRKIAAPVHRLASAIQGESVTLANGTVVPATLVLAALPLFFDKWANEDIAAGRR